MSDLARAQLLTLLSKLDAASNGATTAASTQVRGALAPRDARDAGAGLPGGVHVHPLQPWTNFQGNVQEAIVQRQYLMDSLPPDEWQTGVENVCAVVRHTERLGSRLRSVGSAWSSSPVSRTPLDLLHCGSLAGPGPAIAPVDLAPGVDPARIAHLQAGTVIQTVNELLERNGQSLQVMGGNGGQNIAGAVSTGTHGSWIDRHALADTVHALALVGAGGKRYWIEPASRPLTRAGFGAWGGFFEVLRDDALFSAAQVSAGALGIVTSLVLDVAPLYWIDFTRVQRAWDATLRQAVFSPDLDLTGLLGDRRPAHFEVVLNPYQLGEGQKGVFMETGYVVPPGQGRTVSFENPHQAEISTHLDQDLWGALAQLLSDFPSLVPHVLDLVLPYVYAPVHMVGPLSQVWHVSTGGPPLISTELAVPQEKVRETMDLLLGQVQSAAPRFYWPGVFGVRFGRKTGALLGFTRFKRWCTMELVYLRGVRGVEDFLDEFYAALRARGIEHGVHWGQVNFLDAEQVRADYGESALAQWHAARRRLGAGGSTFANQTTDAWGLTTPLAESA